MTPRPNLHVGAMAPYKLADLSASPGKRLVSLAQNESAFPPSPLAVEAARAALGQAGPYPDPDWQDLRAVIAGVHGLDAAAILCGAGSMELILALALAYLGPGGRALTTAHGYLFFRTAARLAGAGIDLAPESGLTVDVEALMAAVGPQTRVVFVANPGNPTGTRVGRTELLRLRRGLPDGVMLVVDEAYGEFADAPGEAMFDLVARGDTVVLRTLSKAYGLAGMRVGWGAFPPEIAAQVRKVLPPNNISAPAQAAAAAAMRDQPYMAQVRAATAERRDRFAGAMRRLGLGVPQSHTNFVLIRFPSPEAAASADTALRAGGVAMRPMASYGLAESLRATIGAEEEMDLARDIVETWASRR